MTQPPLVIPATVEVPQAEKTTLSNGATLYTLASDDFEVLRITFVFRAGSAVQRVPFSASAAANMLAEGTRDMTAQQIAEQLDYYGSYFESMSGIQFQLPTLFADWQVRNEKDVQDLITLYIPIHFLHRVLCRLTK